MKIERAKSRLSAEELPKGFSYPRSFGDFLLKYSKIQDELEPWGLAADPKANPLYSEACGREVVQFAQAWHEDMIACFVVDPSGEPVVVVLNPWAQDVIEGKATPVCRVVQQLPTSTRGSNGYWEVIW